MTAPGRIWLVGCGNMAGAMLRRWIDSGAVDAADVTVLDPGEPQVPDGVAVRPAPDPAAEAPDLLMLGVKPQVFGELDLGGIAPRIVVSIMAGIGSDAIAARFPGATVIRAMPNLPVGIGKGVVMLHGGDGDADARASVEALMAPLGLVEWTPDEALLHAVTAVSGSGPGFVYRFIEAMAEAGAALGLPADQAERLAIATVGGAADLAADADVSPGALADRVASPNGTTRAGLDVLDRDEALRRLVAETLSAAARRSAELAGDSPA